MFKLDKYLIYSDDSVEKSIKRLNEVNPNILFIINKSKKLLGSITDGDVRRFILKRKSLKNPSINAANLNPLFCKKLDVLDKKEYFQNIIIKKKKSYSSFT